jgi:hypothetical protein
MIDRMRRIVVAALLLTTVGARAQDMQVYRYRDTIAIATSNLRRTVYLTAKVPYDREFAELTSDQQARVRSVYNDLPEPDQPPWPKGGLRVVLKDLVRQLSSFRSSDTGTIMAVARVNAQGVVEKVEVYKSPSDAITSAASKALFNTPFAPARRGGALAPMDFLLDVELET